MHSGGGVNSVKAETVKLYSTGFSGGGAVSYADGKLTWTGTSNNVLTAIEFNAGVLSYFSKIKFSCSTLTEGASFRVIVVTKNDKNEDVNFIKSVTTTGEIEISINELTQQWGSNTMTEEQIAKATQLRIGGGSDGTVPASLTIDPTTICLETSWESPMQIGSTADWNGFSLLVKNGLPSLNAIMTANVDAGSTMVGIDTDGKRYTGTFDGAGHTLNFTYSGSDDEVAPFKCVKNAKFKDIRLTGSINTTGNLPAGLIGKNCAGTTIVDRCYCSTTIISTRSADGTRVAGFVGRSSDNGALVEFNYCMYDGIIGNYLACGFVAWANQNTITCNHCFVASTEIEGGFRNFTSGGLTNTSSYYLNKFNTDGGTQGTALTNEMCTSGQGAYNLNSGIEAGALFFGQNLKAASSSPLLTNNPAYKVYSIGNNEYANSINTIGSSEDWILFSKLVAAGQTDLDVTMTADVNAGTTMVGSDSDGKRYHGTFDGAGHTLTFNYTGSDTEVGPFKCVYAATFKDLHVTGTITSSGQLIAGLIGKNTGATTITRCISSVKLTTNHSDSRPGGFVGRSSNDGANITFSYCMYDGKMDATKQGCGFVGWAANQTMNVSHCLVSSTSISGGESNFIGGYGTKNISDSYYLNKFGNSTEGTQLDNQLLNSGQAAWTLNQGIGDGAWFFGQGKLNASNVEACPTLTTDPSKKVVRTKASGTSTDLYVNPGGAAPNAVRMRATGFSMTDGGEVVTTIPSSFTTDDVLIYRTSASFKFKVSAAGATTLIVPFNVEALPDGMTAYNLDFDGTNVTATPVSSIRADEPVLINAPAGEYTFNTGLTGTIEDYASRSTTNGSLTGVYNEAGSSSSSNPLSYVPANAYVLQNGTNGLAFYKVDEANKIKITSFRAYLTAPTNSRSLRIVYNDSSTGIDATQMNNEERIMNSEIYNLSGQRIDGSQLNPGIYIKNGQKVAIK